MAKPVVVVAMAYLLIASSLLFFLSRENRHSKHPRRLHHHVAFDPLVDQLERRAEEKGLLLDVNALRERVADEIGVFEHYFGEEWGLNTTERLAYLFPLLDVAPMDGFISFEELEVWNRRQAMDRLAYSTEKTMRMHDKDGDGEITLSEYLPDFSQDEKDWSNKDHGKAGWWKEQFMNADVDGNGSLNETEFRDFLHPEDSSNPKIQLWLQTEKLSEMDQDQDGKLNLWEFDDEISDTHELDTEQKFAELDVNSDKLLTAEELKPIIYYLQPGELYHATYYTKYLMQEADDNKDGKLSLDEMLDHHDSFYNAVFEEEPIDEQPHYEDYDSDDGHDEFR